MIDRALLHPRAASPLLWASAMIDALFVVLLLQVIGPTVSAALMLIEPVANALSYNGLPADLQAVFRAGAGLLTYLVLFQLYWLVTEVVLRGRTLGRMILMLEPQDKTRKRPKPGAMVKRGLAKMASFGLTGLGIKSIDRHDLIADIGWASPLQGSAKSSTRNWTVQILSGQRQGQREAVERARNFATKRQVTIGRDPAWADIILDQDEQVSSRHAILRFGKNGWEVADMGSSNGISVKGKRRPPKRWHPLPSGGEFQVANIKMRVAPRS